ncbi:MAG: RdgB/HAM1 family non-canonical purine NTP pyrophosphatase [Anaerolineae bacterium]
MKLLIATHNPGKAREYRDILAGLELDITDLDQEGITLEPEETGATFAENAVLKARAFAAESGLLTLADDSGLEVDALNGKPGVYSARYGGTGRGEDVKRYERILAKLAGVPWERRTARFRCVIALAQPDGPVQTREGTLEGFIAHRPRGTYGFGYDPIFYIPEFERHLAELDPATKHRISHRGRAARAALPLITRMLKGGGSDV